MNRSRALLCLLLLCFAASIGVPAQGAETQSGNFVPAVAVSVGSLGIGGDFALSMTRRSNVRMGFNFFDHSDTFDKDNVTYKGTLGLRSFTTQYDYFLFKGFHVSPGVMLYDGNNVSANINAATGTSFSLGGHQYTSSGLTGTGKLSLNTAAPMLLFGFGNLVPRSHRHVSVSFDMGAAYQGAPKTTLNLSGTVCDSSGCLPVTNSAVQANVVAEQAKLNKSASPFRYYPVAKLSLGYKF